ncbi:helix-turn-helix transcriptional regulator [Rhodobacter capsulatus]|uniref:helix-turn-helix transcriptional regulator n=1 Tax=Rhodobacter capsulatus TaxID=1061 RepID=UPI004028CE49
MTAIPKLRIEYPREEIRSQSQSFWTQLAWVSAGASPLMAWRRAARMSVADLARASGVTPEIITAIESRDHIPNRLELVALSTSLGLSVGDLED